MGKMNADWKRCYWIGRALVGCVPEPQGKKYVDMTKDEKISKLLHRAYLEATGTTFDRQEFSDATSFKG